MSLSINSLVAFHWLLLSILNVEIAGTEEILSLLPAAIPWPTELISEYPRRGKTQGNQGLHPVFTEASSTISY